MTVAEALEIAVAHHGAGRLGEAEAIYRQVLAEYPDTPEALNLFGALLHQYGRNEEAVVHLRRAIALAPEVAEFHAHLAVAFSALGDTTAAIAACRQAIALRPQLPEAHYNLGLWLAAERQDEAALQAAREAVRLRPAYLEAHNSIGNLLAAQGRVDEAIAAYQEALRVRPDYAPAHYNLANMLVKRGEDAAAIQVFRTALALSPDFADAHYNLGNSLHRLGDLDAAAAAYEAALRAQPRHAGAHWHLGNVWKDRGRIGEALAAWGQALEIEPHDAALHSTLVLYIRFDPATTPELLAQAEAGWNQRHASPLRAHRIPHTRKRDSEKRLRIGYVSPDFWDHAVGRNVLPLFSAHDPGPFEIFCYSDARRSDALTERLRAFADHWHETAQMSDEALAARIRDDDIDILVDLALHTGGNRLLVFAREPAPVQFSFAGYPGGTGLETIGHRISDPRLEGDRNSRETTHLIDSFWCFDPVELDLAVNALPATTRGYITFGCLNHACKVNDPVLALWAKVLRACPGSRLLLLSLEGSHRLHVVQTLEGHGVARERVEFAPPCARAEYMRLYHRVDLMLDTFPYGGHTTSLEALWMGVPIVTLPGALTVSRAGLSQLHHLDLTALVARDADDFVRIAAGLAGDLPRLAGIRRTLRPRMERSALMDAARFARGIENACRTAWRQWCQG